MARYECSICGYVFDESQEGESWDGLPHDWTCPVCGAEKSQFEPVVAAEPPAPPAQAAAADPGQGGPTAVEAPPVAAESRPPRRINRAVAAHRVFGFVFLTVYVVLLVQMIPRLWNYQIEFPARTVLHIALGMTVGTVLLLKIAVVRFFRRLDPSLVPLLGTATLVASVVLIGISVPGAFQDALASRASFAPENLQRVQALLTEIDVDQEHGLDASGIAELASPASLRAGRRVLRHECTQCHDLRTVLARPRTPKNWWQTVRRMSDRTTMLDPLETEQQWQVTAYLVAVSPQLRLSTKTLRAEQQQRTESQQAAQAVVGESAEPPAAEQYDPAAAERLFQAKCSQCHEATLVAEASPGSEKQARELVAVMVEEGLEATEHELSTLVRYLTETFVASQE